MAIQVENPARILDHGQEKPIVKFTLCDFILISLSLIVYVADIVTGESFWQLQVKFLLIMVNLKDLILTIV